MSIERNYKIGIDARFYGPVGKGLGRYTQEVVDKILSLDQKNNYVIFLSPDNFSEFHTENPRIKKVLVKSRWYSWAEQVFFPWQIYKEKLDLVHFTHFNVPLLTPTKFVVTIHDLILTRFPTRRASQLGPIMYRLKYWLYRLVIWHAIKFSQQVITVSKFTRDDLNSKFRVKESKVRVIYEGVTKLDESHTLSIDKSDKTLSNYNLQAKQFMLYVGNAYPHKNLEGLLNIFKILSQKFTNLKLVLVGKEDYFYTRVRKLTVDLQLTDKVVFTDYVADDALEILYNQALVYIFPSFYEGFGLPPLEAMSQGCPVISSDQGSLPEILGKGAAYFNPYNLEESVLKITQFLENKEQRNSLIQAAYNQITKYDWQICAQNTLNVYLNVLN